MKTNSHTYKSSAPRRFSALRQALLGFLLWGPFAALTTASAAAVIYSNNFEQPAGAEWSNPKRSTTPVGGRQFLGDFYNVTNSLTLTNLPPHTHLYVAFDLFVLRSWDGNGDGCCGPDIWDFRLAGSSQPLVRTTFSDGANRQAYPENRSKGDYFRRRGAFEVNSLGYTFDYEEGTRLADAVYPMSFSFAHDSNTVVLQFSASGLSNGILDESWGLDNVVVAVGQKPDVRITTPANNEAFSVPACVTLSAEANPTGDDPIQRVEFYANRTLLGVLTNAPWSLIWSNGSAGVYTFRARAVAKSGAWSDALANVTVNGLQAEYFNGTGLAGPGHGRIDPVVAYNWGSGKGPAPGVTNAQQFSARWQGFIVPLYSETYTLKLYSDDGVRLWINDVPVIDAWYNHYGWTTGQIALTSGVPCSIKLEYYSAQCCGAWIELHWQSASQPSGVIPQRQLFPPCSFPPPPRIKLTGAGLVSLDWRSTSCGFELEAAEALECGNWTTNITAEARSETNGVHQLLIRPIGKARYFRLHRP
jgi:hypothetical protein